MQQKCEGVVHVWVLQVLHIPEICCQSTSVLQIIHTVKRGEHQGKGLVLRQRPPGGAVWMAMSSSKFLVTNEFWKHHFKVQKVHGGLLNDNETPIVKHNQSLKIPVLLYIPAYCTITT